MRPIIRIIALLVLTLALTGCYEDLEGEPPAQTPPPTSPGSDLSSHGAGSSLGKAKDSAENTVDKAQQHNEELMKQMEDE